MTDIARTFEPKTILLWRQAAEDPEALRILELFPSAQVQLVERQRFAFSKSMSPSQVMLAPFAVSTRMSLSASVERHLKSGASSKTTAKQENATA